MAARCVCAPVPPHRPDEALFQGNRRFPPRPGTAFRRLATPLPARPPGDVDSEVREGRRLPRSHHRSREKGATVFGLSNREKLGMDQVFVVWTSKSGLNQPTVV